MKHLLILLCLSHAWPQTPQSRAASQAQGLYEEGCTLEGQEFNPALCRKAFTGGRGDVGDSAVDPFLADCRGVK